MQDTLITFETAKLAKEKGFKIASHDRRMYGESGNTFKAIGAGYDMRLCWEAPTQSLLQKWLFETYNIWVSVEFLDTKGFYVNVYKIKGNRSEVLFTEYGSNPYILKETGLFESLKLIKK